MQPPMDSNQSSATSRPPVPSARRRLRQMRNEGLSDNDVMLRRQESRRRLLREPDPSGREGNQAPVADDNSRARGDSSLRAEADESCNSRSEIYIREKKCDNTRVSRSHGRTRKDGHETDRFDQSQPEDDSVQSSEDGSHENRNSYATEQNKYYPSFKYGQRNQRDSDCESVVSSKSMPSSKHSDASLENGVLTNCDDVDVNGVVYHRNSSLVRNTVEDNVFEGSQSESDSCKSFKVNRTKYVNGHNAAQYTNGHVREEGKSEVSVIRAKSARELVQNQEYLIQMLQKMNTDISRMDREASRIKEDVIRSKQLFHVAVKRKEAHHLPLSMEGYNMSYSMPRITYHTHRTVSDSAAPLRYLNRFTNYGITGSASSSRRSSAMSSRSSFRSGSLDRRSNSSFRLARSSSRESSLSRSDCYDYDSDVGSESSLTDTRGRRQSRCAGYASGVFRQNSTDAREDLGNSSECESTCSESVPDAYRLAGRRQSYFYTKRRDTPPLYQSESVDL
ncbi:uncharacterized protein LOC127862295 [Dreissena polymorpha]|uniref:uncharacterized protein LOC127862295 n=1 Tax=Dreissena polymorpha TaxID=45954 RepID=UPI002264AE37|nr:uncharacterized protein LOC127862295 [Dreissena polymorpha]